MYRAFNVCDNPLTRQGALYTSRRRGDSHCVIDNPLTCQGALCNRRERQGDSQRVIDNPLTCQGALCNRRERQGDSQRVIDNPLTCQGALCNRRERQGDSQRVIDNPLTCQGALCNRRERQGDGPRVVATAYDHGSCTTVQKCDLLKKSYNDHTSYYQILFNAYEMLFNVYDNVLNFDGKLRTLKAYDEKVDLGLRVVLKHAVTHDFGRSRSRIKNLKHTLNRRDREPSRIPVKRLVNFMYKNKKCRCRIKIYIKRFVPKSSAWHNLLSTQYRKNVLHRQTNAWRYWKCPCCAKKIYKTMNKHKLFKLGRTKVLNTISKCNKQRLKTSARCSLFVCGDIELNPGPEHNPMTVLTTRLERIGLRPVNIVGDGNCFFRSISYQIYHTESHHAQIRALAIQHLISCPEYFIESNVDQSWMQYLQNMSRLGTWADHIVIQAVANSHNLRIYITESAPNFSESTIVSSVYANQAGANARDIYIGHLDEMHYISTTPVSQTICQTVSGSQTKDVNQVHVNKISEPQGTV